MKPMTVKILRQQAWFRAYEAAIQQRDDYLTSDGRPRKICWDAAKYQMGDGKDATEAGKDCIYPYAGPDQPRS